MTSLSDRTTMLRLVLGALGLGVLSPAATAGCGSVVIEDPTGGGGAGGSGATGGNGGTTSTTVSSTNAGGTATTSTVSVGPGGSGAGGSGGTCTLPISSKDVDVPTEGPCKVGYVAQYVCFPPPKPPAQCTDVYSKECVLDAYSCGFQDYGDEACGPDPAAVDACCYIVVGDCPIGRPFLVDGRARVATVASGDGWADTIAPDVSALDDQTRAALADYWAREGLFEHASVASFARFVMHLLAAGAPADLVRGAQRAMGDEIAHATLCFGLASAYSGSNIAPSALDIAGGLEGGYDATRSAVAAAREGCLAESVAALQVAAARDAATDPAVKQALARVADEEMEHALLSWRYLGFALEAGDASLRAAVAAVFAEAELHVGIGPVTELPGDREGLLAHGYLRPEERRALAADALAQVVMPAARALFAKLGLCGKAPRTDVVEQARS